MKSTDIAGIVNLRLRLDKSKWIPGLAAAT